jgi:maltooligosyltrehalose trehalohydrolase
MRSVVGAIPFDESATRFVVWTPQHEAVRLHLVDTDQTTELEPRQDGYYQTTAECEVGTRCRHALGDGRVYPECLAPQPDCLQGPSRVVDPGAHVFYDNFYRPRALWDNVSYELHVGTFTAQGTFDAAITKLDNLFELGVSAVEIMPVAQFSGRCNWGFAVYLSESTHGSDAKGAGR